MSPIPQSRITNFDHSIQLPAWTDFESARGSPLQLEEAALGDVGCPRTPTDKPAHSAPQLHKHRATSLCASNWGVAAGTLDFCGCGISQGTLWPRRESVGRVPIVVACSAFSNCHFQTSNCCARCCHWSLQILIGGGSYWDCDGHSPVMFSGASVSEGPASLGAELLTTVRGVCLCIAQLPAWSGWQTNSGGSA